MKSQKATVSGLDFFPHARKMTGGCVAINDVFFPLLEKVLKYSICEKGEANEQIAQMGLEGDNGGLDHSNYLTAYV